METLWQDVRYALRLLAKRPGFAAVTVLILGLGICANTAVFSFLDAMVLRPFVFREPDRIVRLWSINVENGSGLSQASPRDILYWRENARLFADITGYDTGTVTLMEGETPLRLDSADCFANFFSLLGIDAALGRTFSPEEGRPGNGRVVVVSHGFWQRHLGGELKAVGRTLTLDGNPYTVIGVLPADFEEPSLSTKPELWLPYASDPSQPASGRRWAKTLGRLKPEVSVAEAQTEIEKVARQMWEGNPENRGWSVVMQPLQRSSTDEARTALLALLAVVGLVLIVACINVANLMLARGLARQQEFAMRVAIGAGRARLVRQLLVESFMLAGLGGLFGLALTPAAIRLLVAICPEGVPRLDEARIDGSVLAFTLAVSLLAGLISGLAPALRFSTGPVHAHLKEGSGRSANGGSPRLRNALVAAQLALSMVLLVVGALLGKSFLQLLSSDPGFAPDNVLTMEVSLPGQNYPEPHQVRGFFRQALDLLSAQPEVESAGAINMLPFTGRYSCYPVALAAKTSTSDQKLCAEYRSVGGDYFRAMGIRLVDGRWLGSGDGANAQPVVVVNQTMARLAWPGQNSLGQRLRWDVGSPEEPWRTVVGVAADVKHRGLDFEPMAEVYVPYLQDNPPPDSMMLVVRTAAAPLSLLPAIRSAISSLDHGLPVYDVKTMSERINESLWLRKLGSAMIGLFSALALLLAMVGLYGVVSFLVNLRRHEFGIRMVLGARRGDVLRLVVRQGLKLVLIGLAIGLAMALAVSKLLGSALYGVSAFDPVIYAAVFLALAGVAVLACYLPALRASRVNPAVGLRSE